MTTISTALTFLRAQALLVGEGEPFNIDDLPEEGVRLSTVNAIDETAIMQPREPGMVLLINSGGAWEGTFASTVRHMVSSLLEDSEPILLDVYLTNDAGQLLLLNGYFSSADGDMLITTDGHRIHASAVVAVHFD